MQEFSLIRILKNSPLENKKFTEIKNVNK